VDFYIDPQKRTILESQGLADFTSIWRHEAEWFEPPNHRRGGWSGVNRLLLQTDDGSYSVFLKRQENHQRRTFRHPLTGVPTFLREFSMLLYLKMHGLPAPRPVFFATKRGEAGYQAILMTEALTGYEPLESLVERLFVGQHPDKAMQHALLDAVAKTVRQLHALNVQHRCLYPKHIFVRTHADKAPDIALIDFEKARVTILDFYRTYIDLAALNRHAAFWTRTKRLYFFKQYLGTQKLNTWQKWLCRLIVKRSRRG